MITFKEYLEKAGYSPNRYNTYKKALYDFQAAYPDKIIYTKADIDNYCSASSEKNVQQRMRVIEKYLRYTLKLVNAGKEYTKGKSLKIQKAVELYISEMKRKNHKDTSISYYEYIFSLLTEYLNSISITNIIQIDKNVMNAFKNYIFIKKTKQGKPYDIATQQTIIYTVKHLFDLLVKEEYLPINPARKMKIPKTEKKISRNILSKNELEVYFKIIDTKTAYGFMDRTIFELLYSTGIRLSELLNLKMNDVNTEDNLLTVLSGKGDKDRVCILNNISKKYLEIYLKQVRKFYLLPHKKSDYLFPSILGNRLDEKYISKRIKRYSQLANIEHNVSCHAFRRSFATHLIEENVDIRHVQKLMGHEKIDTTMGYIKVTAKDLRNILIKHHPRESFLKDTDINFNGIRRS